MERDSCSMANCYWMFLAAMVMCRKQNEKCKVCDGTGYYEKKTCVFCDGTGESDINPYKEVYGD